jgi:hypothetical protein
MWYIVGLSAIVSKCLEVGINFFDTAEVSYLNQGIEIYKSYIGCYYKHSQNNKCVNTSVIIINSFKCVDNDAI